MFGGLSKAAAEQRAKLAALDRAQGVIEFDLDGHVLNANDTFLKVVGYALDEVRGRHHSLFVDPAYRDSEAYRTFWASLRRGEFQAAQYRRLGKNGREVWIEASYNPLFDRTGRPYRIVKFATDITRQKAEDADRQGQIDAIRKSQGVIAFDLDGHVLDANANFLKVVGYTLPEIVGRHHRLFVEPALAEAPAYAAFWNKLRAGEFQAGQFRRVGQDGRAIWIEASYNPILDASGRPYKVVKFATDVTAQVKLLADLKLLIERNFGAIDGAVRCSDREADEAAQAAGSTVGTVQTMAAAAEELAASVSEISAGMAKSRAATDAAHAQVASAAEQTEHLSEAAIAMGGIVKLIQAIAGQINLLALNATIESARAGEAGRGFAVVAQEVKSLANQAARATERISAEIDGVQAISRQVAEALGAIQGSVGTMRDHVVGAAAAVEEQSVVTRDMSANMQDAARAVAAISHNILSISGSIAQVSRAVETTKDAARVLAR
ncbi:PAS domain-containing methyl-accepting chemotaxis protein [Methylobacterium durans]|uniref:methyl-accepting chemotaxis protein n=1 Tax=Methylobacterium durans TaxID=2202825 RepID=UPI002AFF2F8F|nr:PAS domain-containing methyl-accepting chemotaxis protein [Methylobacterium durans]MEA1834399.1 PAS domain-containing methyl-accepting chemotaxis protein [Methylobacterium durans]